MEYISPSELNSFFALINLHPIQKNESRLAYLNLAVHQYSAQIPFQNIFLLSKPPQERKPYNWEDVKSQVLSGEGGFCIIINLFFFRFLQTQGYNVHLYNCAFNFIPDNHCTIIAKDVVKEGDSFLVDVSTGFLIRPISLNFEGKTEIIQDSFTQYYMEWDQKKENLTMYYYKEGTFTPIILFNTTIPYSSQEEIAFSNHVYCDPTKSSLHSRLRLVRYPSTGALLVINKMFYKENENHTLIEEKQLNYVEDFLEVTKEYFPLLNQEACRKAYLSLFPG